MLGEGWNGITHFPLVLLPGITPPRNLLQGREMISCVGSGVAANERVVLPSLDPFSPARRPRPPHPLAPIEMVAIIKSSWQLDHNSFLVPSLPAT